MKNTAKERCKGMLIVLVMAILAVFVEKARAEDIATVETDIWYESYAASEELNLYWPTMPVIEYNASGSPVDIDKAEAMINYA